MSKISSLPARSFEAVGDGLAEDILNLVHERKGIWDLLHRFSTDDTMTTRDLGLEIEALFEAAYHTLVEAREEERDAGDYGDFGDIA